MMIYLFFFSHAVVECEIFSENGSYGWYYNHNKFTYEKYTIYQFEHK